MSYVPTQTQYSSYILSYPETNITMYQIALSSLGQNESFMTVYTWIQNLLRSIIPLFVLITLNSLIIHALRVEKRCGNSSISHYRVLSNRITKTLVVVIVVFVICIFPDAILSTFFGFGYVDEGNLVKGIREFTDLLLSINSAVNFFIYCMFSKGFGDVFWDILCTKHQSNPQCL